MTAVQFAGGDLTEDEARHLTDQIKGAVTAAWVLLLKAHERRAWAALGYSTWREYAMAEFQISESRAYQILDQGRVIREIEAAAGSITVENDHARSPDGENAQAGSTDVEKNHTGSTTVDITEAEARDLKPVLPEVTDAVREQVAQLGPQPEPQRVREVVREVIAGKRDELAERRAYEKAVRDFPELAHYADQPHTAVRLARTLRNVSDDERPLRRENLARAIAADKRGRSEPVAPQTHPHTPLVDEVFDAVNATAQLITRRGGIDLVADRAAEAAGHVESLRASNWRDQFADMARICDALARACRPAHVRSVP